MAIVALASGGVDSLVMCKLLEKQGEEVLPLFIDYGQLANSREWEACKRVLRISSLPKPEKVNLNDFGMVIKAGITDRSRHIVDEAFLPGRNLLFLVVASSYAYQKGVRSVAIGLLSERTHLFPDQTEEFIVNANFAINSALNESFTIVTPLIQFSKKDVFRLAKEYGLPVEETYSCHSGEKNYCGSCVA